MSKILLVVSAFILLNSHFKYDDPDCKKLKNGRFLYHSRFGNNDFFYLIIRKGTSQQEINQKTGDTTTYFIEWTGSCSYNLYFKKNSNPGINTKRQASKNLPMNRNT